MNCLWLVRFFNFWSVGCFRKYSSCLLVRLSVIGISFFELIHVLRYGITLQHTPCSSLLKWILKSLLVHVCVHRMVSNCIIASHVSVFGIRLLFGATFLIQPRVVFDLFTGLEHITGHVHLWLTSMFLVCSGSINVGFFSSWLAKYSCWMSLKLDVFLLELSLIVLLRKSIVISLEFSIVKWWPEWTIIRDKFLCSWL